MKSTVHVCNNAFWNTSYMQSYIKQYEGKNAKSSSSVYRLKKNKKNNIRMPAHAKGFGACIYKYK